MIPKVIHYCWFGRNPLPPLAVKCIDSWKKYLPDYEIKEWNEDNFDVNMIAYTKEAYEAKKYAFVSDYARVWILYHYGGVYFDTDVEVIRPLDEIISKGPFMGRETLNTVALGLGLGANSGNQLLYAIMKTYENLQFLRADGSLDTTTIVCIVTDLLVEYGLTPSEKIQKIEDFWIYPPVYFCPISIDDGVLRITDSTYTIHHYAESWRSPLHRILRKLIIAVGGNNALKKIKSIRNVILGTK